jgi:hypothetical protein
MHHPHLHCVTSGGGLSPDESRWIASRDYYFLPVRLLSSVFRSKFRRLLERAFERGELGFYGELTHLADPNTFRRFLDSATQRKWVVYAKRAFRDPACVLKYLARYTHRVAISNRRLVDYRDGKVTFRYKDYAQGGQQRTMTLEAAEFIRRFFLHVLPHGFMRIRHYGYLANRYRRQKLEVCRRLLGCDGPAKPQADVDQPENESCHDAVAAETVIRCPSCKTGRMQTIERFDRRPRCCGASASHPPSPSEPTFQDSS